MNPTNYLRQRFLLMAATGWFIIAASAVSAQGYRSHERDNDRDDNEYRYSERNSNHHNPGYHWKDRRGGCEKQYSERHSERGKYHPKFKNRKYTRKCDYFDHPEYGRVYNRMDHRHLVFRHKHGDYYYFGDRFYRYHTGIGYCVTDPPRDIYFSNLPVTCERVRIDGHIFYRHGNLYFDRSSRGYLLVPAPLEIRFSARF